MPTETSEPVSLHGSTLLGSGKTVAAVVVVAPGVAAVVVASLAADTPFLVVVARGATTGTEGAEGAFFLDDCGLEVLASDLPAVVLVDGA